MKYFLDTNICIYFLKGSSVRLQKRLLRQSPSAIAIPALVKAELLYGVFKSRQKKKNQDLVEAFLAPFAVLPFDEKAVWHYAEQRAVLERKGCPVGPNDLIIAATVLAQGGTLVTHNVREFRRITGLLLQDWY